MRPSFSTYQKRAQKKVVNYILFTTLPLFCTIFFLQSCTINEEQKAQKAIKEFIKQNAEDPDSYESLDLKVDSTNSYYYMESVHEELRSLLKEKEGIEQEEHNISTNGYMAKLWRGVDNKRYKQDRSTYNNKLEELRKRKIHYNSALIDLKDEIAYLNRKKFPKTKYALNKFRIKNKEGNYIINHVVFLLNNNSEHVDSMIDYEELSNMEKENVINKLLKDIVDFKDI